MKLFLMTALFLGIALETHASSLHWAMRSCAFQSEVLPVENQLHETELTENKLEERQNVREILKSYTELFVKNPKVFAPFYRPKEYFQSNNAESNATMLYRELCGQKKPICKPSKPLLIQFFKNELEKSQFDNRPQDIAAINDSIHRLRSQYWLIRHEVDQQIYAGLLLSQQNFEVFNFWVDEIFSRPQMVNAITEYNKAYLTEAAQHRSGLFFTQWMRNFVEKKNSDFQLEDLILAIHEMSADLRRQFRSQVPQSRDEMLQYLSSHLNDAGEMAAENSNCSLIAARWFHQNTVYPSPARPETFALIKKYEITDITAIRFITQKLYQQALWRLRDISENDAADKLEEWILQNSDASQLTEFKVLGGGFTTTHLASFKSSIQGVYKPASGQIRTFQNLMDYIVSDFHKEIAAYRMDRLLGLNHVPLTREIKLQETTGSLQYFIKNTASAKELNEVDPAKITRSGKWSSARGKTILSPDILFFDWLINNRDRNLDNYLYTEDNRVVLIDHGWSFVIPGFIAEPTRSELLAMIPSKRIYENARRLQRHPEILDREFKHLLSRVQINAIQQRLDFIVRKLENSSLKPLKSLDPS